MKNLIVFDLDGPILEGSRRHYICYSQILEEFGLKPLPFNAYWKAKRDRLDQREILNQSGAYNVYDTFSHLWLERIESPGMLNFDRPQPGVHEILNACNRAMIRNILVTDRQDYQALVSQLNKLELQEFFEDIIMASFDEDKKDKASVFNSKFQEQVPLVLAWIGDTEVDIIAARQLGITSIALTCGLRDRFVLESFQPDYIFNDLIEVFNKRPLSSLICDTITSGVS